MSSSVAVETEITGTTEWGATIEVFTTAQWSLTHPCWWVVDVDVRGGIFDTRVIPTPTAPRRADFGTQNFAGRVPLHLQLDYQLSDCDHTPAAGAHRRIIDAATGRLIIYANTITVSLLAPPSTRAYDASAPEASAFQVISPTTLAAFIDVAASPTDAPDSGATVCTHTWRQHYNQGDNIPSVRIPNGALRAQVFDSDGDWEWREPTFRGIAVAAAQSQVVIVPGVCAMGPRVGSSARDTAVVFEVKL